MAAIHWTLCQTPSQSRSRKPAASEPRMAPIVLIAESVPMLFPAWVMKPSSLFMRKGNTAPSGRQAGPMVAKPVPKSRIA